MRFSLARRSVALNVVVVLVTVITLVLNVAGVVASRLELARSGSVLRAQAAASAARLASLLELPVWNLDQRQIGRILASAMADRDIAAIEVDGAGAETIALTRDQAWAPVPGAVPPAASDLIVTGEPVMHEDQGIGSVRVFTTSRYLERDRRQLARLFGFGIALVDLVLVAALFLVLRRAVLRPLRHIEAYATAVSAGEPEAVPSLEGRRYTGELERLRGSVATMVEMLEARLRALRESEQSQREIVEGSRDAIFVHEPETGRILAVNRGLELMYGFRREDVIGKTVDDLSAGEPPYSGRDAARWLARTLEEGPQVYEWRARRKDGSLFWVEVSLASITVGGERRLLATVRDTDARRRIEEEKRRLEEQLAQAQKMESVGRLAGGVAHDFNNMLMVILGEVEMLKAALAGHGSLSEHLQEIERAGLRSRDIVQQLLAFSRKQVVSPQVVDVAAALRALQRTLSRLVGEGVKVELALDPDLWPVRIDPTQLDQVVINLATNARDAMPGGGRLELAASNAVLDEAACHGRVGWRPGAYVCFTARDEGEGMDAETLTHVFEPFFTGKAAGKGTGLGLATVYGIVTQGGGFIDVASAPGAGATFRIHLPRAEGARPAVQPEPTAAAEAGRGTVLLIDDNALVRATTSRLLRSLGFGVLEVSDPAEAVALCQGTGVAIDLLVSDVVMPEMSGPELAHRLLALRPGLRTLFMSGYSAELGVPPGLRPDQCRFLQKPFTRADLAAMIREVMAPSGGPEA